MNTVKKGDKFESTVANLLQHEIDEGRFWSSSECCKLHLKKGYYSHKRKKDIIFDVAIEISIPQAPTPSLVVLIECKHYSHPVPVDDIEEFWAKICQVSGVNVKGMFATNANFQSGTLEFAKSEKFALLRLFTANDFKWILYRSPSTYSTSQHQREIHNGLTSPSFKSLYFDCFFLSGHTYTNSINTAFERIIVTSPALSKKEVHRITNKNRQKYSSVKFIAKKKIEEIANSQLNMIGYKSGPVNLNELCEYLSTSSNFTVQHCKASTSFPEALGAISFYPTTIKLFSHPEGTIERSRFTLAHEIGHFILNHKIYFLKEYTVESDISYKKNTTSIIDNVFLKRLEWQANFFASCLLLPYQSIQASFMKAVENLDLHDRGFGPLYLDYQPSNQRNFHLVCSTLNKEYKVSREAIFYRLKDLNLITDARKETNNAYKLALNSIDI